jgi:hypothetical protein
LQPQGSPLAADDFAAFHAEWVPDHGHLSRLRCL